jgi:hypothetical protein
VLQEKAEEVRLARGQTDAKKAAEYRKKLSGLSKEPWIASAVNLPSKAG